MTEFKREMPKSKYRIITPKAINVDEIIENCINAIYRNKIMLPPLGTYRGVNRQETNDFGVIDGYKYVSVSFPQISAWVTLVGITHRIVWWHEVLGEGYLLENNNGSMTFFPNGEGATEDFVRPEWLVDNTLDEALEYEDDYSEEENDEDEE